MCVRRPPSRRNVPARPPFDQRELRRRQRRFQHRDKWWGYALIAPAGLGLAVFYLWPVVQTVYYSFTQWGAFGGTTWIGLSNYRTLVDDPEFWQSLGNTGIYTGLVLLGIPLSMVLAVLLNLKGLRGTGFYRTFYFLPVVTMPAAVAVVWRWLYNGDVGILNHALSAIGIDGTYWVSDPDTIRFAVAIVGVWMTVGYNMILLLAGLQSIPADYYEAASLDGAGRVRQFFSVTLPLLSPTLFFTTVLSVIQSLQVFDLVYLIIGANTAELAPEPGVRRRPDRRDALLPEGVLRQPARLRRGDRLCAVLPDHGADRRPVPVAEEVGPLCLR